MEVQWGQQWLQAKVSKHTSRSIVPDEDMMLLVCTHDAAVRTSSRHRDRDGEGHKILLNLLILSSFVFFSSLQVVLVTSKTVLVRFHNIEKVHIPETMAKSKGRNRFPGSYITQTVVSRV